MNNIKDYRKMLVASHLLPDQGGEVARDLIDEIEALRTRIPELERIPEWMMDYYYLHGHFPPALTSFINLKSRTH